jgi:hypothetical protein
MTSGGDNTPSDSNSIPVWNDDNSSNTMQFVYENPDFGIRVELPPKYLDKFDVFVMGESIGLPSLHFDHIPTQEHLPDLGPGWFAIERYSADSNILNEVWAKPFVPLLQTDDYIYIFVQAFNPYDVSNGHPVHDDYFDLGISNDNVLDIMKVSAVYSDNSSNKTLYGHMVIEGDIFYLDEVEIVRREDKERIAELGLLDDLPPNGYHIHRLDKGIVAYELTDETEYNFMDVHRQFIDDSIDERWYTTTIKDEFIQYLNRSYSDSPPAQTIPYLVEVKDGKVISVTEEFIFTF